MTFVFLHQNELFYIYIVEDDFFFEAWLTQKGGEMSRLLCACAKQRDDDLYIDEDVFLAIVEHYLEEGVLFSDEDDGFFMVGDIPFEMGHIS